MPRATRRSLKALQHTASDENLVGRASKSLKHQLNEETVGGNNEVEAKKKNLSSKVTQVNLEQKVTADDLTNPDGPSVTYWKTLAQRTQITLQESQEENVRLRNIIDELKEKNAQYKQMLDEANTFIEIFKEELSNSNNDTGIDVNDVSTADETQDDINDVSYVNGTYDGDTDKPDTSKNEN